MLAADPAPPSATATGAAEWHVDVPPAGAVVDNHLAHREFFDEPVGLADVSGEHRCLQAKRVTVGDTEQLFFGISHDDRHDRAERLFGCEQAVEWDLVRDGELVVQVCRLSGPAMATSDNFGPAAVTVGHVP